MPKKIYITNDTLQSIKCKNTAVKKLRQFTQNLRQFKTQYYIIHCRILAFIKITLCTMNIIPRYKKLL